MCSIRKYVRRNLAKFTGIKLRQSLFNKACDLIEKETLPQVFSWEFCQISKNAFFTEHFPATASVVCKNNDFETNFFKKNNLLGKTLKPPLFCSPFFWLKTYFFNETKIDYSSSRPYLIDANWLIGFIFRVKWLGRKSQL